MSTTWNPIPVPIPCTYPGGQALLAVQADATLIGDLGEVFILKLLEADVVGEPGGSGDWVTHCMCGEQEGTPRRGHQHHLRDQWGKHWDHREGRARWDTAGGWTRWGM